MPTTPVNKADRLYRKVWKLTRDAFYVPERLTDWNAWRNINCWSEQEQDLSHLLSGISCSNRLLEKVQDEYSRVLTPFESDKMDRQDSGEIIGVGITVARYRDTVSITFIHPGSPAQKAGLAVGDILNAVNGIPVSNLLPDEVDDELSNRTGQAAFVSITRDGKPLSFTLVQTKIQCKAAAARVLPDTCAYLYLPAFTSNHLTEQLESTLNSLSDCRGLVLDLRHNTGGFSSDAEDALSLFLKEGVLRRIITREVGQAGVKDEIVYLTKKSIVTKNTKTGKRSQRRRKAQLWSKPMVTLINHETASAAEFFAAALQENKRSPLLGGRTFGKGIGQESFELPDSAWLELTTHKVLTPSGHWPGDGQLRRYGIQPDLELIPKLMSQSPYYQLQFASRGRMALEHEEHHCCTNLMHYQSEKDYAVQLACQLLKGERNLETERGPEPEPKDNHRAATSQEKLKTACC